MKDLHIHTVYSDGELTIEEIINEIKEKNVDFFSITDHDTVEGNIELINKNLHKKNNLKFVTGIELSARINVGSCHILGYNIDLDNKILKDKLNQLKNMEYYNTNLMVKYLNEHFNFNISKENIEEIFNKKGSVNNVEISKLLVKLGYCNNSKEAFKNYIQDAKRAIHPLKQELSPYECIQVIRKAGGVPVLAHNYQLKKDYLELKKYLIELKSYGLMGLECYHSGFKNAGTKNSLQLANELDLLVTGGSDYHGVNVKPDIEMGIGKNNLNIKKLSIEKYLDNKLKY